MEVSYVKISLNTKAIINFKLQEGDEESRVIFLSREMLEKIKQKEQNRLSADVTNVAIVVLCEFKVT